MIKISFVIPVYNRSNHIRNTLESLNQLVVDNEDNMFEVIVIDDGSDSPIYESIKGIKTNYELKYYYLERYTNSCLSRARNVGWKLASGDLIAFIDSDILLKEDYLEQVYRYYNYSNNILVMGTRLMLQNNAQIESILNKSIFKNKLFNGKNYEVLEYRYFVFNNYSYNASSQKYPWLNVYGNNLVIPKAFLQDIGGFDEEFKGWGLEDIEFAYRCYKSDLKILINSKIEVLHQFHGYGDDRIREHQLTSYRNNIAYFIKKHPDAISGSTEFIYDVFEGKKNINHNIVNNYISSHIIDFRNADQINTIKELILELSNEYGNEIIINDYVEKTDIDIWIQLLGVRKSTPKYYIASRKFDYI